MEENKSTTIQVSCPCCDASLTVDPVLAVVLDHKVPAKPQMAVQLRDAVKLVKEEATRRDEKYQKIAEAEKNKSKVLEAKFQELRADSFGKLEVYGYKACPMAGDRMKVLMSYTRIYTFGGKMNDDEAKVFELAKTPSGWRIASELDVPADQQLGC